MQIHELTYPQLNEGILNGIKSVASKAAGAVSNAASAAGKAIASTTSWDASIANKAAKTTAAQTAEYVDRMASEWQTVSKSVPREIQPAKNPDAEAKKAELDALKKEVEREKTKDQLRKSIDQYGEKTGKIAQALIRKGDIPVPKPGAPAPVATAPLDTTKISAPPKPGAPTPAEMAKLQQRIQAAASKQVHEAFTDLPGSKPAVGGAVDPSVTAPPSNIKRQGFAGAPRYTQHFQNWVDTKLASVIPGTTQKVTMSMVRAMPEFKRNLNLALAGVVNSRANPQQNDEAVKKYLTLAVQGMQAKSAQLKQENPALVAKKKGLGVTIKSTGNPEADQLLIKQGYKVAEL